jgi:sugar O-acyltransferase (sialic acid O-acetyltransferase NeuD family)
MKRLAIIGAGHLGQQIAYHAKQSGEYITSGFFDDFATVGTAVQGIEVLGNVEMIEQAYNTGMFDCLMVGIGYKHFPVRKALFERFSNIIPFASIIHPSAFVDKSCTIGKGAIIYPGCTLDMKVTIGDNVLINAGCTIAHDSTIGSHSFLSPGVSIAGFVSIKEMVSLGIGTVVIDNVEINRGVRTGAGAVVIRNLMEEGLYIGVPADFKKR